MNPRVISVSPDENFYLHLEFSNGEKRKYSMRKHLETGIFKELKDERYFKKAKVTFGTVSWPNNQDICPDTLYLDSEII
jgi:hypothetical protein